jgi:scyllo-inositol 2-dehydrogenase (NAD+)
MRAAVIGCGRMGARDSATLDGIFPPGWLPLSHADAFRATSGVELAALCDTNEDLLKACAERLSVRATYTDYRKLIDEIEPAIIGVATRTPAKEEIIKYACHRGVRAVYVEKPLANSLNACRELLSVAAANQVVLGYGVNRRYHVAYREAKRRVESGVIGELRQIIIEHGRAPLLWSHPHSADLMLFFANTARVLSVQASLASESVSASGLLVDSDPIVESAFIELEGGVSAQIVQAGGLNLRLAGTKGTLTVHGDGSLISTELASAPSGYFLERRVDHLRPETGGATVTAFLEMIAAVNNERDPPISGQEIEAGLGLLLGMTWSHLQGGTKIRPIDIPGELVVTGRSGLLFA